MARLHSRVPYLLADGISALTLRRVIAAVRFGLGVPIWDDGGSKAYNAATSPKAVEAHRDVQPLGKRQAAGANPAIGTRHALQALTAERRTRNPEVDRAIRS